MSTGPEHYAEAEALTERAHVEWEQDQPRYALTVQLAQVHATLALAAATYQAGGLGLNSAARTAWTEALTDNTVDPSDPWSQAPPMPPGLDPRAGTPGPGL